MLVEGHRQLNLVYEKFCLNSGILKKIVMENSEISQLFPLLFVIAFVEEPQKSDEL